MNKNIIFIIVALAIFIISEAPLFIAKNKQTNVACTMEAKLCPDGSYVGRTGSKCEFTTCPPFEKLEKQTEFNKPVTLQINDEVSFSDGTSLTLKEINDSRCKPGVQCIWQGELSFLFSVNIKNSSEEVRLGTVNNKKVSLKNYAISLENADEKSSTIIISVDSESANTSGINGYVHLGPTCPVERIPPDPNCAEKPYINTSVTAVNTTGKQYSGQTDLDGNFKIIVPAGSYSLYVAPVNILPRCEKTEAVVSTNKFTVIDISCDTGIR